MKNKTLSIIALWLICSMHSFSQIKVACIGNSITFGHAIVNRAANSYPTQLQYYLGTDYQVENFGASGRTLLSQGDYPYTRENQYRKSLDFVPDIVLIKLGTNDTKSQNRTYLNQYKSDYLKLIQSYQTLPSRPRVILLTPAKCFVVPGKAINDSIISNEVIPFIKELAYENGLEVIDLYRLLGEKYVAHLMPDKIHPSSIGAGMIAERIGAYLSRNSQYAPLEAKWNGLGETQPFNFHGYKGVNFQMNGAPCRVVSPKQAAIGKPWIWRARFWGHEPQTDIDLLENGFHVVYCDVSNLYGSPVAVARWDKFYALMQKNGLNKKVVLEAMSRGGLIVYNWAARNTDKVACIYADAPVLDFKSWPLGEGTSKGSSGDAELLLKAYGFTSKAEALKWNANPINHAKRLAKAHIPILHVVGDADVVVPVAENTAILESKMIAAGNPIKVIHKPGVGHHPHSLFNPQPIVDFILQSTGYWENCCAKSMPGREYRSGAGWEKEADWHTVAQDISATIAGKSLDLLLLGNSITQGFGGNRKLVLSKPGKKSLDNAIGVNRWESAGISGDRTQNLLWRLQHDKYENSNPRHVIITIGVNNLLNNDRPTDVAEGIIAIAREAKLRFPQAKIILLGTLPAGEKENSTLRANVREVHQILARTSLKGITYINPYYWFVNPDGTIKSDYYSKDFIHLSLSGYEMWAQQIKKLLQESKK